MRPRPRTKASVKRSSSRSDLSQVDLRGAHLKRANLNGAHLNGANLSEARLRGASLSGADLSDADLSDADFLRANLSGADLGLAKLDGVNLFGANLEGVDLLGAVLDGAIFGDHCSPISDTTIMSSIASSCDLMQHVRTQLPYSLFVAGLALFCAYLPSAFGLAPGWSFALAISVMVCFFIALARYKKA